MVGIAQLVSAPDCGSGGPGFESLYPPVIPWEAVPGAFFVFYERLDLKEDLDVCVGAVEHCRESILKMIQEIENELNKNEES